MQASPSTSLSGLILDTAGVCCNAAALSPADRQTLAARGQASLSAGPFSVTHKSTLPPSGDKHDYMSVGPYWWPDPAKSDGLPYIRRDGEVNPDFSSAKYDHAEFDELTATVHDLALAWQITAEPRYARRAADLLRIWFLDPATRMNPHLLYGQSIPGVCAGRGIGLIDTQRLIRLLDDLALIAAELPQSEINSLRAWMTQFLDWMLTHEFGKAERREHNNHGTWCDVQLAGYALFIGRLDLAREVITQAPERRIFRHIDPDGRQPYELARTRSLSYSCYNLEGLFALAWMGRHLGIDLWNARSSDGRCLRAAIDFLARYADASRAWPYPQISKEGVADNPALGATAREPLYALLLQAAAAWQDPSYLSHASKLLDGRSANPRHVAARLLWS